MWLNWWIHLLKSQKIQSSLTAKRADQAASLQPTLSDTALPWYCAIWPVRNNFTLDSLLHYRHLRLRSRSAWIRLIPDIHCMTIYWWRIRDTFAGIASEFAKIETCLINTQQWFFLQSLNINDCADMMSLRLQAAQNPLSQNVVLSNISYKILQFITNKSKCSFITRYVCTSIDE